MTDTLGPASLNAVTSRPDRTTARGSLNTWFKDCTNVTLQDGTKITADWLNDMLAQFRAAFVNSGIFLDNADDMLWRAMQSAGVRYGEDTSPAANSIVAAFTPAVRAYTGGMILAVKVGHGNSGAVTIEPDGLAARSVVRPDGTALNSGDLKAGQIALFVYDPGLNKFQYAGDLVGGGGGGVGGGHNIPYAVATGTAAAIAADYSPNVESPIAGDMFLVKIAADIVSGGTTFSPDGFGPYDLVGSGGAALTAKYALNGDVLLIAFDGSRMRILSRTSGVQLQSGAYLELALSGTYAQNMFSPDSKFTGYTISKNDIGATVSGGNITIPVAGLYRFTFQAAQLADGTDGGSWCECRVNNIARLGMDGAPVWLTPISGGGGAPQIRGELLLQAGDVISVWTRTFGSPFPILINNAFTGGNVCRVIKV